MTLPYVLQLQFAYTYKYIHIYIYMYIGKQQNAMSLANGPMKRPWLNLTKTKTGRGTDRQANKQSYTRDPDGMMTHNDNNDL